MLNYTTKDIIKRAKELADLENSDFISWEENIKLLDESYKKLYQEMINVNDKYYLQTIYLKDLTVAERKEKETLFYLPNDFYQLQSVSIKNSGVQILKKAKTEDKNSTRYDIINNCLVLYAGARSLELEISYYPIPKTLTLKKDDITFAMDGKILDVNNNKVLSIIDNDIIITDINTNARKTIDISNIQGNIIFGLLGVEHFYLLFSYNQSINGYWGDLIDNSIIQYDYFVGKKDCALICMNKNIHGDDFTNSIIYDEYGTEICNFDAISMSPFVFFTVDDFNNGYFLESGNDDILYKVTKDGNATELYKLPNLARNVHSFEVINNKLYIENLGVYCDDKLLLDKKEYNLFIGFNKVDFDTGYGFTTKNIFEDFYKVHSCFTDTILNFPNNFYFSYLSYLLAIAYKQKQNADASFLIQRASEEYAQFLISISRDTAENNRIQNVYNGGVSYYG